MLNTTFGFAIYALLLWGGAVPAVALLVSTVAGVLFNYRSFATLVFADHGRGKFWRFVLVYGVQLTANIVLLDVLVRAGMHPLVAQSLLLPPFVVVSFLALRRFVFPAPVR